MFNGAIRGHGESEAFVADTTVNHYKGSKTMNWDRIEGNWKQLKGNVKEQWGKLTDDNLDVIAGKRDQLTGKIQETYGITKDEAEKQISEWQNRQKEMKSPK
jgi:uncharacterized protein YjbJ (UPF0337 family)